MAADKWRVSLRPRADRQIRGLEEDERDECLAILEDMEDGYFPPDRIPLRGHRGFERVKFYRNAFRIIYQINRRARSVRVTRIVRRDEKTYKGFNPL